MPVNPDNEVRVQPVAETTAMDPAFPDRTLPDRTIKAASGLQDPQLQDPQAFYDANYHSDKTLVARRGRPRAAQVQIGDVVLYSAFGRVLNALVLKLRVGEISHLGKNGEPLLTLAVIKQGGWTGNAPYKRPNPIQEATATPEIEIVHDVVHASHEFDEEFLRKHGRSTSDIASQRGHGEWSEVDVANDFSPSFGKNYSERELGAAYRDPVAKLLHDDDGGDSEDLQPIEATDFYENEAATLADQRVEQKDAENIPGRVRGWALDPGDTSDKRASYADQRVKDIQRANDETNNRRRASDLQAGLASAPAAVPTVDLSGRGPDPDPSK